MAAGARARSAARRRRGGAALSSPNRRYDGLDVLRAGAILLGVFSHAARAYVPGIGRYYPIADPATHEFFFVASNLVNAFRMQVFFALSGFFSHLVLERRGSDAFLRDRARRLVVPFLGALPVIVACDWLVRAFAASRGLLSPGYRAGAVWAPTPLHLWFLEYLFLYCAIAWVLSRFGVTGARPARWLARGLQRPERLVLLSLPLCLVLALPPGTNPARSFVPQPLPFLEFACFFATGWLLWRARDEIDRLSRPAAWLAGAGLVLGLALSASPLQWQPSGRALMAFVPWLVTFGAIGLALRVRSAPRPRLRFLVEASYWVYLVHLPIVQVLQVALSVLAWPAAPKFVAVVSLTFAASVASFAAFVRGRFLGQWLGAGRRPAGEGFALSSASGGDSARPAR